MESRARERRPGVPANIAHLTSLIVSPNIKYPSWISQLLLATYNRLTKSLETPTLESRSANPSLQADQLPTSGPSWPPSNA